MLLLPGIVTGRTGASAGARAPSLTALILLGGLAGGCVKDTGSVATAYGIPTPSRALLSRQGAPKCAFFPSGSLEGQDGWSPYAKTTAQSKEAGSGAAAPKPDIRRAQVQNMVSERDCYRRAEARVRRRLNKLQASVGRTVKALQTPTIERQEEPAKSP